MKNQTGKIVKCIRIGNDLEFCFIEFNEFCRDEGIARQSIVCYTPQQNGVAERINGTLLEKAISILSNLGLNKSFC